jgi:hypothetical protein
LFLVEDVCTTSPLIISEFKNMKILLGDFNAKLGKEDIFKLKIGNKSLHEISNDNRVRVVNFATLKYLFIKSTTFPHRDIHETFGLLLTVSHIIR